MNEGEDRSENGRSDDAGPSPEQRRSASEVVEAARGESVRLIDSLTRLWNDVVEASAQTNNDDEHDPEGATIAFERAHLGDLLRQARADLDDLDHAARRIRDGEYWVCERCGDPISAERLIARPAARRCITCAGKGGG